MGFDSTRASLLAQVRDPANQDAWREFYEIYAPVMRHYARVRGLPVDEADEVVQICMQKLVAEMPTFEYAREKGRFKGWLRRVVNNQVLNIVRKRKPRRAETGELRLLEDTHPSVSEAWEKKWHTQRLNHSLSLVRREVASTTYQAFQRYVLEERPVKEVCQELDISTNQVYLAKTRVTERLKGIMRDLLDENE